MGEDGGKRKEGGKKGQTRDRKCEGEGEDR